MLIGDVTAMKADRWLQIERFYDSALKLEPGARERFLREACAGDESLFNEVTSWLASSEKAGSFLESPALDVLARKLALDQPRDLPQDPAGHTLRHYRIREKIGEGGMGRVYRAEDTTLSRQVAIKVLPDEFAHDAERLARFEREAKLLASLNHPNIASIYGLEQADGRPFLVLELVEGQTLADRLKKGRIPLDETLDICRQIAEGLEAAHEKGIIHRDLKPPNVKVTPEGRVKILDFGLAKAFYEQSAQGEPSRSPTITDQMTAPGVIFGTAAYMSPEQARGKPADRRTDIWAFGCILYECLTGKRAFEGETASETMGAILKVEPDWTQLPAGTPAMVRSLLHRCLRKDPNLRLHDIADARIEIGESAAETPEAVPSAPRLHLPWLIAGAAIILLAGIVAGRFVLRHPQGTTRLNLARSAIKVEPGTRLAGWNLEPWYAPPTRTAMALSSDAKFIVYCAEPEQGGPQSKTQLYIRRIDEMAAKPVAGTEGGIGPFLSPDDRWAGFWAEGKLRKVPIDGGVPVPLCDSEPWGASWGSTHGIVFSGGGTGGLSRVPAEGGRPEALTIADRTKDEMSHRLPHLLPDDRGVLFTIMSDGADLQPRVGFLDLKTRKWRVLLEDGADARYVLTGHLVFLRRGTLMAVPFDLNKLQISGQAVPAIVNTMQALNYSSFMHNTGAGQFSVSASGDLIYLSGGIVPNWQNSLVWVDHRGNAQPIALSKASFLNPRLSPDGQRIAYSGTEVLEPVWVYDINRATATRLTHDYRTAHVTWSPDGKRLVFGCWKSGSLSLFWRPLDGSAPMEQLTTCGTGEDAHMVGSFSPDGATLAFTLAGDVGYQIRLLDLRSRRITPFVGSPSSEYSPEFSPDGRWIAYVSHETTKQADVYVRPYPGPGSKWQISSDGGWMPLWARSGKQLFYRWGGQVWVVDVRTDAGFEATKPRLLFDKPGYADSWDISPDGQRFLMVKMDERKPQPVTDIILVQNWFEELKRLCPRGR